MANPLVPKIDPQSTLNIPALLANPTRITDVLARLTAEQLVLDAFFAPVPAAVTGGGIVYGVRKHGSNYLLRDTEKRPLEPNTLSRVVICRWILPFRRTGVPRCRSSTRTAPP